MGAECYIQDTCSFSGIVGKPLARVKWKGNCYDASVSLLVKKINLCSEKKIERREGGGSEDGGQREREIKDYHFTCWLSWESAGVMMENAINSLGPCLGILKLSHLIFIKTLQIKIYIICGNVSRNVGIIAWFQKEKSILFGKYKFSTTVLVLHSCKAFFKVLTLQGWMGSVGLLSPRSSEPT